MLKNLKITQDELQAIEALAMEAELAGIRHHRFRREMVAFRDFLNESIGSKNPMVMKKVRALSQIASNELYGFFHTIDVNLADLKRAGLMGQ